MSLDEPTSGSGHQYVGERGTSGRVGTYQVLLEALASWEVCASVDTLAELERVLEKKKFDRYLDLATRLEFIALIRYRVHLFSVQDSDVRAVDPHCRDAMDDQFLALALTAEVDVVVSSDEDLPVLNPWRGISIVTPVEFLSRFKSK